MALRSPAHRYSPRAVPNRALNADRGSTGLSLGRNIQEVNETTDLSLLLTGGTGSFGQAFIAHALRTIPPPRRLRVLSRDELKQVELARVYPPDRYPQLEWMLGDVRDQQALIRACRGMDAVVHAAALKQVPMGELHPDEFVQTNIGGARNLIAAAEATGIRRVLALSTSKAVAPLNLYGATKLCADKLFLAANRQAGGCRFSVLRCGNLFGSRGSVVPLFMELRATGRLPVTHPDMTRFHITLERMGLLAAECLERMHGGEIFIPASPSYRIIDLAKAIGPDCFIDWIGIRPGEKLHEEIIANADAAWTRRQNDLFVQLSPLLPDLQTFYSDWEPVTEAFNYSSETNPHFLGLNDLQLLVSQL